LTSKKKKKIRTIEDEAAFGSWVCSEVQMRADLSF